MALSRRGFFGVGAGAALAGPSAAKNAVANFNPAPPAFPFMGGHTASTIGQAYDAVGYARAGLERLKNKSRQQRDLEARRYTSRGFQEIEVLRSVAPWKKVEMHSAREYERNERMQELNFMGIIEGWMND